MNRMWTGMCQGVRLWLGAVSTVLVLGSAVGEVAAQDVIRFVGVGPLTGPNAELGQSMKRGITWAVEQINSEGGINGQMVAADFFDDEAKPEPAANVAQQIVASGKYTAVIGHVNSSNTLAAAPIYARANMPQIVCTSSNPSITQQGWNHLVRIVPNDDLNGPAQVKAAVEILGATKLAFIYENTDFGKYLAETAARTAEEMGVEVVASETYTAGRDADFSAQVTKFKARGADGLLHFGAYGEGGLILNQARRLGLTPGAKIALAGADAHDEIVDLAGKEAIEGAILINVFDPWKNTPLAQSFLKLVETERGRVPDPEEAFHYEGTLLAAEALKRGATKETLIQTIREMTFEGPTGVNRFDETGEVIGKEFGLFIYKDGKMTSFEG